MIALLLAGAALLVGMGGALVAPGNRARVVIALAAQAVATVATEVVALPILAGGPALEASLPWAYPAERVTVVVDPLSAFFLAWAMPMTWLGGLYATGYLRDDLARGRNAGPHFALLSLLQLSYLLVYGLQDTVGFLLGWELAAVSAWLLVIWSYGEQKTRFAGFNYLVSTHVGLFLLAAALMVLRAQSGATWFGSFGEALSTPGQLRSMAFLLLGAAFALKAAFFPGHTWLPRAHAAAPAHISALMSGVIHKAGLYAFLRFTLLLGAPEEWMGWSVLGFGAASAVVGALFSTSQRDLKRLLGYSSTENVGIAAMGFGVGYLGLTWGEPRVAALGFAAGLLHVLNHAWFKCLLFYGAGAVYRATHTVDLERLGGLAARMPRTTTLFGLGAIAIAGLPPLNGFGSELLLYVGLYAAATAGAAPFGAGVALVAFTAVLALTGALSTFAMVRAFGVGFLGTRRTPPDDGHTDPVGERHAPGAPHVLDEPHDPGAAMTAAMGTHALGVLALGVVPVLGGIVVAPVVAPLADPAPALATLWTITPPVLALAVAVVGALGIALRVRARTHVTWGCGYTAATPRMQYTGTSFAASVADWFGSLMPGVGGVDAPTGLFPAAGGEVRVHHPDPVEESLYRGIDRAEEGMLALLTRFATRTRVVFAIGLLGLLLGIGAIIGGLG